jgi:hypothetical protein
MAAFASAMLNMLPSSLVHNEKGAISNSTTGDDRLNYFSKVLRDSEESQVIDYLAGSWGISPQDALRLVAQKRDCRGGSGEKKVFYQSMKWLIDNHPETAIKFMPLVPHYGTWKDGFVCFSSTPLENSWLQLVANQLKKDHQILNRLESTDNVSPESSSSDSTPASDSKPDNSVSLCAKWVPTEGSSLDKKCGHVYTRLIALMGLKTKGKKACKEFRKTYLTPLRAYIHVVESLMCSKQWEQINYSGVPSLAMNRLRKAFKKHDADRFAQFLTDVASGKKTIKSSQLFPHDMVKHYMGHHNSEADQVIEEQWKAYVKTIAELGTLKNTVVISDVSGSMSSNKGLPMQVSVALGLLISSLTSGPFNGQIITFHETPTFFQIDQTQNLMNQVRTIMSAPWGGTTNFQGVFDLILKKGLTHKLKQEEMPQTVVVISDMQFDQASSRGYNYQTNFETLKTKYAQSGYAMPKIVFWNVAGRTEDFPVTKDEIGVTMVSGFSPCHLKYLTTNEVTTPMDAMMETINSERYQAVEV